MSETSVSVWIPGEPQGKGRPRICRVGKFVRAVTPEKTRTYEGIIRALAMEQMRGAIPSESPLQLNLDIICSVPRSWPEWKRKMALDDRVSATTKPDADNVVKAISDACNGVVWRDDVQIIQLRVNKCYGQIPGVQMRAVFLDELPAQTKRRPA